MTPEAQLKADCAKLLGKLGGKYYAMYLGHAGLRNTKNNGVFDWLVQYKDSMFWVEFKIKPRKPSEEQVAFQREVLRSHGKAYICWSVQNFITLLAFNGIKRP